MQNDKSVAQGERISFFGAVLMNINLMIGAAVFMGPSMITKAAGPAGLYGWLSAAILFLPVVYAIAQMAKLFPGKGSFYSYSNHGISRTAGFMSGWLYSLGYISTGALQLLSLQKLLGTQLNMPLLTSAPLWISALFITALFALSCAPLSVIERIQNNATLFKLTPLFIGIATLPFFLTRAAIPSPAEITLTSTQAIIPIAIFGFWGFEGICSLSHQIENNKVNTSRSIFWGFFSAVILYFLFHLAMLALMGSNNLEVYGALQFMNYAGFSPTVQSLVGALVSSAIVAAFVNAIFGGMLANSSMLAAMAEEGILFLSPVFASKTRYNRPFGAAIAHGAGIIFFMTFMRSENVLNALTNIGILCTLALTILSLMRLRSEERDYKTIIISILGLAACALLAVYSWNMIGATQSDRFFAIVPMLFLVSIGYVMFVLTQRP